MSKKVLLAAGVLVVAAAVLTGVVIMGRSDGGGGNGGGVSGNEGGGPVISFMDTPDTIVVEVEQGMVDAPMVVADDPAAGGSKCVFIPEGPNETELNPKAHTEDGTPVFWKDVKESKYAGKALYPNGMAHVKFNVEEAGDYVLWMRAYWMHGCANSFYFLVDPDNDPVDKDGNGAYDDEVIPMEFGDADGTYKVWHWVRYGRKKAGGRPETFRLDPGEHTIAIYNREDGIRLDQVLFVEYDAENEYYPTGIEGQ